MTNPLSKVISPKRNKNDGGTGQGEEAKDEEHQSLLGRLTPSRLSAPATPSVEKNLGIRSTRTWDIKMPPAKKTMVQGKLVPSVTGFGGRLRQKTSRIVIEIHAAQDALGTPGNPGSALLPTGGNQGGEIMRGLLRGASMVHSAKEELHDGETVVVRILRKAKHGRQGVDSDDDDDDDHSVSTLGIHGADEELEDGKWMEAYRFDLDDVELLKHHRHHADVKLGRGSETQVREINFVDPHQAETFRKVLEALRKLEGERAKRKLDKYRSEVGPDSKGRDFEAGAQINILVEIVSGVRLPVADLSSTDAYVVVYLGKEEIHRTRQLPNTINPIWTISNGSLFLLQTTPEVFFGSSSGLTFSVRDYDAVGQNDVLGKVTVGQEVLVEGTGERTEYSLVLDKKHKKAKDALLVLRYRRATPEDLEFMRIFSSQKRKAVVGAYADEAYVPIRSHGTGVLKRESRKNKSTGAQEMRVKPGPDPDRPEDTKWLTKSQLNDEAYKPSKNWIEVGSGSLGKLYFELIGCDGLPNLDQGPMLGGKTDAFACVIYGDSIVNTDVINDTLCPRWMPWSQRAFMFHMIHPSSQVQLGLFDFDSATGLDAHDAIGRVTIDVSNLRPSTDYTMEFNLYTSALVTKRKSKGSVTVRVRIEWTDERKALLSSMKIPPDVYVNVSKKKDFLCAHYATVGKYNVKAYSMDTLTSYIEELREYESLQYVLKEAAFTLLLWRGHFPITFWVPSIPLQPADPAHPKPVLRRMVKPVKRKLPLHSMIAFVGGIILAENYNFFPSFLLFGIAWALIASMEYQHRNPSPWEEKRTFVELWQILMFNRTFTDTITPKENMAEVEKFLADEAALAKQRKEEAKNQQEAAEKEAAELEKELADEEAEKEDLETKKGGWGVSVNPLKPFLYPLQQNLGIAVVVVRVTRSIVTWQDCHSAFWLTNGSLVAGLLLLVVPWDFLIHWGFRIIVWTLLGPWMKLVDMFFVRGRTRDQLKKEEQEKLRLKYQEVVEARRWRQVNREDAKKLKHMKRYMFGNFLVSVPRFKEARWRDTPLYVSHAEPHVETSPEHVSACFFGQHLEGAMIPDREANTKKQKDETTVLLDEDETPKKSYGATGFLRRVVPGRKRA